jgi:putative ABC transport system permease protein
MLRNFFRFTFRQMAKQKGFTFINILGLTIGLTSCILIGLFITDELSYDRFHTNGDRVARVTMEYGIGGSSSTEAAYTGTKVGPQFKRTFPAVEDYTRTIIYPSIITSGNEHFKENKFLYADASFFSIFSFPIVKGDPNPLQRKENIVLTETAAKKYFGTTDVIGKTLTVNDTKDYTVAAVAKDPPRNSQLKFDFVVSFNNLDASKNEIWWTANFVTYLLLRKDADLSHLQSQVAAYMESPEVRKEAGLEKGDFLRMYLEPLKRVHLYSHLTGSEPNGNITYVYVLMAIAVLILVIACFNYTNLAIALASARTGEIGIRKVLGALQRQLFARFTGETFLMTGIALVLSVLIAIGLLPLFNEMTGKQLIAWDILQFRTLLAILIAGLIIGFLAGAYPALVLTNTRLINILRSGFRVTGGQGGLRRTLIVVQFVISLFLIVTTVIILQQMSFIRNKDLGMDRDHVLVLPIDYNILNRYAPLKTAIGGLPGVVSVTGTTDLPIFVRWGDVLTAMTDHGKVSFNINTIPADLNYVTTMKMQLVAGSDFTAADFTANTKAKDSTKPGRYILNETAVRNFGWTPEEAIGKTVDRGTPGIVKGVVKDFNFESMHDRIGPLMLSADTGYIRSMLVRVNGQQLPSTISRIEAAWQTYVPSRAFSYHFMDEDYNHLYVTEQRTAGLFTTFSSLAILLACMGLFGLAAITTVQRTKEIGIRKVMGADMLQICLLISKNFLGLVVVAILIAAPLAWLAAGKWLETFAYRIPIHFWIFLAAGAGVALLAFGVVSYHALRAASINPAKSLKTE